MSTDRSVVSGYHPLTKFLHWTVLLLLVAQAVVGLTMNIDDSGQGRGRGRGEGSGRGRGRGGEGSDYEPFGDDAVLTVHVVLGVSILVLVLVRLVWRWRSTLPPWAPGLSPRERAFVHGNERVMYVLMIAVPTTGLALIASGDDDLVWLHVSAQVLLLIAVTLHVGLVLSHQFLRRDRILQRML